MSAGRDQVLTCNACGGEFTLTADEQEFYERTAFLAPTRCEACRAAKRGREGEGAEARGGGDRQDECEKGERK